ncbi:MAG TPA: hypothetical protein VMZ71_00245 [Gemmataceae bacterium]|nr:hypothetical protein [Gemmataceae bacterium]
MRPTDLTRADLHASSALYATTVWRKPKLADTFTRRGKFLAGDQWDAILANAVQPEPTPEAETPAPKGKGRKARGI